MAKDKLADDQELGDGEQSELFPSGSLEGDGLTLKQLVKAGQAQQVTTRLDGTEVPTPEGGLLHPEGLVKLLVTGEVKRYEPTPLRTPDDEGKVRGWKIRQIVRPVYVERVDGDLTVAISQRFAELCETDVKTAGALLDRLGSQLAEALE